MNQEEPSGGSGDEGKDRKNDEGEEVKMALGC